MRSTLTSLAGHSTGISAATCSASRCTTRRRAGASTPSHRGGQISTAAPNRSSVTFSPTRRCAAVGSGSFGLRRLVRQKPDPEGCNGTDERGQDKDPLQECHVRARLTARSRDEEGNSSIYLGTPRCWFPLC